MLAAAVLFGAVGCESDAPVEPTSAATTEEAANAQGVLILEAMDWVKDSSQTPVFTDFPVVEDEKYRIESMFGIKVMEIVEVTDTEVTVRVEGDYFTPDGIKTDPTFILEDGESVGFDTASADAGTSFQLKYTK